MTKAEKILSIRKEKIRNEKLKNMFKRLHKLMVKNGNKTLAERYVKAIAQKNNEISLLKKLEAEVRMSKKNEY